MTMETLKTLLTELRGAEIKLLLEADQLKYRARGPIAPELRSRIVAHKPEIIAYLQQLSGSGSADAMAIPRSAPDEPPLLSFSQQRLWFLEQIQQQASAAFNLFSAMRLTGKLDRASLQTSFDEVVRRHESLRATFRSVDGLPVPVFAEPGEVRIGLTDLRRLPPQEREKRLAQWVDQETLSPFDLEKGPLLRVSLLQLADEAHALAVTMHHIVSDGWSLGVFVREFAACYARLAAAQPLERLPPLPIRYRDYAAWQHGWYAEHALDADIAYWERQLQGIPELLELPTDRQRPPEQRFKGGTAEHTLAPGLIETLNRLGQSEGASLFMTLLAAFKLLLSRLSGQTEIVVGAPNANRNRVELEDMIGFFINTLALRGDLSANPSFRALLGQVRETTLAAYARQDAPFEKIVEKLQPERDASRNPLFQVFFNMVNLPESRFSLPDLEITPLSTSELPNKFDLTLYLHQNRDGGIFINAVYNAALFSPARMHALLAQYAYLLEQIAVRPDHAIDRFSLVDARAREVLPDPRAPLAGDWPGPVHELFRRHADATPDRIALDEPGRRAWSYGRLSRRADQLTRRLQTLGIGHEDVVAVYGHRNASVVWGLLGILGAGATFVMLDPVYPADRLLACLELAPPRAWLEIEAAGQPHDELIRFLEQRRIPRLMDEHQPQASTTNTVEPIRVGPDSRAYLAFTSGSTGQPKAVEGRHGPLSQFMPWTQNEFGLGRDDRFSMLSGLAHDPLQRDIFTPLALGARICIPCGEDIAPQRLARWLAARGVTVAHLTPAMGQILAETDGLIRVPDLRLGFFVGDILTRRDVARLHALAPRVEVINYYGSTETQRSVSYHRVARGLDDPLLKQTIIAGRGIPGTQLIVFNRAGEQAGIGELGEIAMRSRQLARGYLDDPILSRAKFIENPFSGADGDRLYRTGDLGRYLPNGEVDFAGRLDHQIKIRGFRVEPGEIQAKLGCHPSVREAVVLARENKIGDKTLQAFWVAEPDAPLVTGPNLRDYLKARLPEYMVPAQFMRLDHLPLTPNGKLDRAALPQPRDQDRERQWLPLETPTEQIIAGIWSELLDVKRIGRRDEFFALGGHSLLAARMISRVRAALGVDLPLRLIFSSPVLDELALAIDNLRRTAAHKTRPPLKPVPRDQVIPLSFAQKRLWFLDQLQGPHGAYNMPLAMRLRGRLVVAALQKAVQALVQPPRDPADLFPDRERSAFSAD